LNRATETLTQAGVDSPQLDSELLLAEALGKTREGLYLCFDQVLQPGQADLVSRLVKRRANREPMAYILGRREFWGRDFKVGPGVLIPRPETEILIEEFLGQVRERDQGENISILDVGTGSGNIAITVAKELPQSRITAVDISPRALEFARENARIHGVLDRVRFVEGDWFDMTEVYDAILSNPPYIPEKELANLMKDVQGFEPGLALDGGREGLEFYRRMIRQAGSCLKETGWLVLEIGYNQANAIHEMLERHGDFSPPVIRKDLSGKDRVVSARKIAHG
jgi:release factor glutamine methyltransferase